MKTKLKIILVLSIIICISSCTKDFIVQDIVGKAIVVNAPANNLETPDNSITFWWEPLEGAEKYTLQVVRPNFTSIAKLLLDTTLTKTKYTMELNPGSYQWRIKAIKGGGGTEFQVYSLTIDSTVNLANQVVVPIGPLTGYITGMKNINYSWNSLSAASNYSIELSVNNAVVHYSVVTTTTYAYTFNLIAGANHTCTWRVRAMNENSISNFNTAQSFTIDLAPPAVSTPSAPVNNALVMDTVRLKWNRPGGTDTEYDSLFVYTDAGYLNLARTSTVSTNSIPINQISLTNPLPSGTSSTTPIPYWWRLKSVDERGNTSGFSNGLSFQLHQ